MHQHLSPLLDVRVCDVQGGCEPRGADGAGHEHVGCVAPDEQDLGVREEPLVGEYVFRDVFCEGGVPREEED